MLILDLSNGLSNGGLSKEDEVYQDKKQKILEAIRAFVIKRFFYVKNEKITDDEIKKMFKIMKSYFSQKEEVKECDLLEENFGYCKLEEYEFDYKEAFNLPPNFSHFNQSLPEIFEKNRPFLDDFTKKCNKISQAVLSEIALALDLDKHFFYKAHEFEDKSCSIIRALHYPPLSKDVELERVTRAESKTSSKWINMPYRNGYVIANIADLLSVWTEGKLCSTKNRVVLPPVSKLDTHRYSVAYFLYPKPDFLISPIRSIENEDRYGKSSKLFELASFLLENLVRFF
ncbi:Clavaminate synthase-like protein [Neoconidiobolus thromboides FSU 785]|nr:Clavaminate synthase-like protein [Neoconidiobolus thromboides FSU 785]